MHHNLDYEKREQLKETDKIKKKQMLGNLHDENGELKKVNNKIKKEKQDKPWYSKGTKGILKEIWKKGKGKSHNKLDNDKREQTKESDEIVKNEMCDNVDDNKKGELKSVDSKRKKKNVDNLDTHEKELLKKYEKSKEKIAW